ncbi:MAG: alpha/beta hydrolase [Treponemataceae bacterium]|nr:alpha/beta hydrolase [Treponemataceae bacterium]
MKALDRKSAINRLKHLIFTPGAETIPFRKNLENEFKTAYIPDNVEVDESQIGNVKCDYLIPEIYSKERVIIYVHGGSFVAGSRKAYRSFCCSIANASLTKMYVPEFRLSPENPYPAPIDDVSCVIDALKDKEIILMADGSGAGIALACVFNMNRFLRKNIKEIILFSPWLDFSPEAKIYNQKKPYDEVLTAEALLNSCNYYTYHSNQKNPLVSPLNAGEKELENFPDVYIQNGEKELLFDTHRDFANLLYKYGAKCTIDTESGMMFMYQMADEFIPQAHLAVERVGMHIQERDVF